MVVRPGAPAGLVATHHPELRLPSCPENDHQQQGRPETVLETTLELRAAVSELKEVLQSREIIPELAASVPDEPESLENELACRLQHSKDLRKNV